ncbi:MAG: nucleotide exchange factor GrpE [Clostridiales bacterium]|nr:nucleotide exchange factor GrpE [Clostridiales bacterium]
MADKDKTTKDFNPEDQSFAEEVTEQNGTDSTKDFMENETTTSNGITMNGLLADLEKATSLQEEYLTLAQRVQADFDNFRKRNQSVRAEAHLDGASDIIKVFLPVVDNIERALEAGKDSQDQALYEGVELVHRQIMEIFEKQGIQAINRLGEKFDPNIENAMLQGSCDDGEPGTVCAVMQKGYKMNEVVLRYAMVQVVPE